MGTTDGLGSRIEGLTIDLMNVYEYIFQRTGLDTPRWERSGTTDVGILNDGIHHLLPYRGKRRFLFFLFSSGVLKCVRRYGSDRRTPSAQSRRTRSAFFCLGIVCGRAGLRRRRAWNHFLAIEKLAYERVFGGGVVHDDDDEGTKEPFYWFFLFEVSDVKGQDGRFRRT